MSLKKFLDKELLVEAKKPDVLLKTVINAEKKMAVIRKAMDEVVEITKALPEQFRLNIHAGNVHNLDTPKEYAIMVGIENVKALYLLNEAYRKTFRDIDYLKQQLTAYGKS